jgi:hypothetical protein
MSFQANPPFANVHPHWRRIHWTDLNIVMVLTRLAIVLKRAIHPRCESPASVATWEARPVAHLRSGVFPIRSSTSVRQAAMLLDVLF